MSDHEHVSGPVTSAYRGTWIVVRADGGRLRGERHRSYDDATAEAERLARANPGVMFHTLQDRACTRLKPSRGNA